jgi:hypothetical protein
VDLLHVLTLAGLLVLSAAAFFIARDFGDGTPSGGNVFPQLVSGVVFLTAAASLVMHSRAQTVAENGGHADVTTSWNPLIIAVLTFGFLILLPIIGYPILAPLWLCAVMRVFGMRSPLVLGLVSIGLSALAWTLLSRLAYAPPPAGLFEHFL